MFPISTRTQDNSRPVYLGIIPHSQSLRLDYHRCILTWFSIEQIKKLQRNGSVEHEISIIWMPRRTLVSNKILEDEGVLGDVSVSELPLYFLGLESDVLSLELEDSFSDLYLVRQQYSINSNISDCQ
jgi:hypothetical protein